MSLVTIHYNTVDLLHQIHPLSQDNIYWKGREGFVVQSEVSINVYG